MLLSDALIIDATERLGWLAGRLLADLGADVIKIAQPGTDRSRPEWRACNVNKRILELDPQIPGDRMRIEELLRTADICLLTPAPCSTGSFLDPHALRRDYPRLVVVAIRPFGGVGPRRTWKASDIELMAAGGAMALAGEPDGMPVRISEPQSYGWAGAYAAAGALVALFRRDTTGRGDLVDVSAQASVIAALSHAPAFVDLLGIEPTRAGAFMTGRSITGARYRVFWPCRDGYINFIFYGGAAGRRTNEQLVVWMRECGAELGALAAIDWKSWDPTKADQAEVDAIEAPVATFFARLTKREFLIEGHRRGMLGYPVATVADIASDPQLEARGFFQTVADSAERFCGSFAVIDGKRPPLRHHPDAPILAAHALCSAPHRTGAPSAFEIGRNRVNPISAGEALGAIRVNLTSVSQAQRSTSHKRVHARLRRAMAKWCAADPGSLRSVAVSDQRRTASLRFALHRIRDTWLKLMPKGLAAGVDISARSRGHNHDPLPQTSPPREDGADRVRCSSVTAVAHALCGLKVLEFGGYAAGPHIGKLLANFGASTIHMESRERPDGFRIQYPPFKDNRPGYNRSGCFAFFNDSKYSVTVDLKKPAGIALARRMAQWCDLIIENMRPGVMERLGLGFAVLSQLNPRLVMLSSCNMGQTGPRADQPGFGSQLSALAGMCEVTGVPEGPPMLLYGPYIDYIASLLGTSAALAAVIRGRRTGKGALIDLSQYECGLTFMGAALWDFFANGRVASRRGNDDPVAMPHGAFPCCEREWVAISCWSDADFASLAQAIGDVKLATDARFATAPARRANRKALDAMISAWTAQRKAEAAATALQAAGVAAYPVVTMAGLFSDPQLRARRQFRVRRHPEMGDHTYCFPGFDLEDAPGDIVGPAPCVGADNDFVFRDLIGLSEAEYETYRRQGVFD